MENPRTGGTEGEKQWEGGGEGKRESSREKRRRRRGHGCTRCRVAGGVERGNGSAREGEERKRGGTRAGRKREMHEWRRAGKGEAEKREKEGRAMGTAVGRTEGRKGERCESGEGRKVAGRETVGKRGRGSAAAGAGGGVGQKGGKERREGGNLWQRVDRKRSAEKCTTSALVWQLCWHTTASVFARGRERPSGTGRERERARERGRKRERDSQRPIPTQGEDEPSRLALG